MKQLSIIAVLAALIVIGCGPKEEAAQTSTNTPATASTETPTTGAFKPVSYEKGSKKKGDKGICVVCSTKAGKPTEEEDVKVVMDYKDRTYVFCSEAEEAEFIADPKKFAGE